MYFRAAYVAPLALSLLTACSLKFEDGTTYYKEDFSWEETQSHMNSRVIYNEAKSADGEDLGLGLVMSAKDSSAKPGHFRLGACTGFLLDKNTLATNSHCVPKKVRDEETSCSHRVKFAYSGSARNFNCKTVLFTHKDYDMSDDAEVVFRGSLVPDITLLEIEDVENVKYFKKSNDRIRSALESDDLKISSVDPHDTQGQVVYEAKYSLNKEFEVGDLEFLLNTYRYLKAKLGAYFIKGNSGSPVHDSSYNVKAIGFAGDKGNDGSATVLDLTCLQKVDNVWTWNSSCVSRGAYRRL